MKYPIGIQDFEKIVSEGYAYVDKTAYVYDLVSRGHIYFLSRPRRFGKSLLLSTIKHYFLGHKHLFRGLAIEKLETQWNAYPVFHLSFGASDFTTPGTLDSILEGFVAAAERQYGSDELNTDIARRFMAVLRAAHRVTGRRAVVLVDEYDKPLLDVMGSDITITDRYGNVRTIEDYTRNALRGFYGAFKDADEDLQFVILTGISKCSQVSVFSGLNQPNDISLSTRYQAICGITTDELRTTFGAAIEELAESLSISTDEAYARLQRQYDGYHFSERLLDIYNPFSIINCLEAGAIRNFWFTSGTPTYLVRMLEHSNLNINELADQYYTADQFVNYKADAAAPLPMIYQSGYLTIKEYNPELDVYRLDFPNQEVRSGFIGLLATDYFQNPLQQPANWAVQVQQALLAGNVDAFISKMTALMASATYRFQRKNTPFECERYFQYTFYLILQMVGYYNTVAEKEVSEGRIDCVIETPQYVYVIEFKLNGSADQALQQIADKHYAAAYADSGRKVLCIGINFSSERGTIADYRTATYPL